MKEGANHQQVLGNNNYWLGQRILSFGNVRFSRRHYEAGT